jgi:hypothetical protein
MKYPLGLPECHHRVKTDKQGWFLMQSLHARNCLLIGQVAPEPMDFIIAK